MKIYGEDYTCLLDDKERVVWGYGEIPFDEYKPHPLLMYYSHKGLSWFSTIKEFYEDDFKGRGKPVVLTIKEYLEKWVAKQEKSVTNF